MVTHVERPPRPSSRPSGGGLEERLVGRRVERTAPAWRRLPEWRSPGVSGARRRRHVARRIEERSVPGGYAKSGRSVRGRILEQWAVEERWYSKGGGARRNDDRASRAADRGREARPRGQDASGAAHAARSRARAPEDRGAHAREVDRRRLASATRRSRRREPGDDGRAGASVVSSKPLDPRSPPSSSMRSASSAGPGCRSGSPRRPRRSTVSASRRRKRLAGAIAKEAPDVATAHEIAGLACYRLGLYKQAVAVARSGTRPPRQTRRCCPWSPTATGRSVAGRRSTGSGGRSRRCRRRQEVMAEGRIVAAGALADQGDLRGAHRADGAGDQAGQGGARASSAPVVRARRPVRPRRRSDQRPSLVRRRRRVRPRVRRRRRSACAASVADDAIGTIASDAELALPCRRRRRRDRTRAARSWRSSAATCPAHGSFRRAASTSARRPRQSAWRELYEETGLGPDQVDLVDEYPGLDRLRVAARARSRRQASRRPAPRSGAALVPVPGPIRRRRTRRPTVSSSSTWKWVDPTWLLDHVVEFRRPSYRP